jgi:hypothetical protein
LLRSNGRSVARETPAGDIITPATAPGVSMHAGQGPQMRYFRCELPVAIGTGAHAGTWHALLTVDPRLWKRYLDALDNNKEALARAQALGARYSVSAYAWSNLRMRASLEQTSLDPGSTAHLGRPVPVARHSSPARPVAGTGPG